MDPGSVRKEGCRRGDQVPDDTEVDVRDGLLPRYVGLPQSPDILGVFMAFAWLTQIFRSLVYREEQSEGAI